jgi:hypothetical protein
MGKIIRLFLACFCPLMLASVIQAQATNQVLVLNEGGYVRVESRSGLQNPSALTIAGWLYPVENGVQNPVFLSKGDLLDGTSDQSYWMSWSRFQGAPGRSLSFNLFLGPQTWAGITANNVASNEWIHFAVTYDSAGSTLKLFTNGVVASLRTVDAGGNPINSLPIRQSTQPLMLGHNQRPIAASVRPAGAMDEIRIWSRVLSAEEVLVEYRCGAGIDSASEAKWSFNAGTATDDSGRGNHGVLGGDASVGTWVGANLVHAECRLPRAAQAKATVVNGFVVGAEMTDNGFGYQTAPQVYFLGGDGTGAVGLATVKDGIVTGISITSAGSGYTSPPRVLVAAPPGVPSLGIAVKQVEVRMNVSIGFTYKLQRSEDLATWTDVDLPFLATESVMLRTLEVRSAPEVFRLVQLP